MATRARTSGRPWRRAGGWRLAAELGLVVAPDDLVAAGTVTYEVVDPVSGLVEREYDHLFVGRATNEPHLDPAEVADITALSIADLPAATTDWSGCTAWFPIVLRAAMPALVSLVRP